MVDTQPDLAAGREVLRDLLNLDGRPQPWHIEPLRDLGRLIEKVRCRILSPRSSATRAPIT